MKGRGGGKGSKQRQHGSLMTTSDRPYCAPPFTYARIACTVSAPERPQIDAATGPDTAQLAGHDLLCVQYVPTFPIRPSAFLLLLYVAYRSPALQPFSIETTETRMPLPILPIAVLPTYICRYP